LAGHGETNLGEVPNLVSILHHRNTRRPTHVHLECVPNQDDGVLAGAPRTSVVAIEAFVAVFDTLARL
jgi:hypothetical protein